MRNKKSQFEMSFNTIFSIFLIVIFIVVAGVAINYFLNISKCSQINLFADDLQKSIDEMWKAQKGSTTFSANLPSRIEKVCFADMTQDTATGDEKIFEALRKNVETGANFYFYPLQNACGDPHRTIKHINITELENPYCIDNKDGKIEIKLNKDFFDAVVRIQK